MTSLNEIRQLFFVECEEQLEQLTECLNAIETAGPDGPVDSETINTMFRAVHSIKGGAASFALDAITRFAHAFETALDEMRGGRLNLDRDRLRSFYVAADFLSDLVDAGAIGEEPEGEQLNAHIATMIAISAASQTPATAGISVATLVDDDATIEDFQPMALDFAFDPLGPQEGDGFLIHFQPTAALYANGHEPVQLFREVASFGNLSVEAMIDDQPSPDADQPCLSWRLTLQSACSEHDISEIFEFAEPFADIRIEALVSDAQEILHAAPVIAMPSLPQDDAGAEGVVKNVLPFPPDRSENQTRVPTQTAPKATVRVDLDLVDDLINKVGELVITQSVMSQSIAEAGLASRSHLSSTLEEFRVLTRHIQEGIMAIRAQSLKPLFQRMGRIVRETAQIAGKEVRFVTGGEETEVDRTVIERLVDPLTHILRNAIDHGLEPAQARRAAGKGETGTVTLTAAHRSGRVLIEVRDDGGGVDRDKVLDSAIRKGLVSENATLTPAEIDRLLFMPGFSTASSVTNLSGRGVGMDVVTNEIRKLGGRVSIASKQGGGTVISISLPLTLAVLDGMIVDVAGQKMVVPISAIVETIRPEPDQLHRIGRSSNMVTVRDTVIPISDLGQIFAYSVGPALERGGVLILVEDDQGKQHALAVDGIFDQRQVVIKSLDKNYGRVPFVAAATILGDGQIALIVDLDELTLNKQATMPTCGILQGKRA